MFVMALMFSIGFVCITVLMSSAKFRWKIFACYEKWTPIERLGFLLRVRTGEISLERTLVIRAYRKLGEYSNRRRDCRRPFRYNTHHGRRHSPESSWAPPLNFPGFSLFFRRLSWAF
ncbi:hypothetical protein B0H11DRAFT_978839 [Mycena galericulata]|nr:hypothetical protein B0H11DRAFT_978839 [Mycena galericulata]